MSKHYAILGGGISGLSLAWYLRQREPEARITLIERTGRLGGKIETIHQANSQFELGPRGCRPKGNGLELLKLIESLDIKEEVSLSDPKATKRYIYHNSKLRPLPNGPLSFIFSSLTRGVLAAIARERNVPPSKEEDESIYDFFSRRFSSYVADTLIDPMVLGIYAGNCKNLSIKSCFPKIHQFEQEHGSVIRGMFSKKPFTEELSPWAQQMSKAPLLSFKGGMQILTESLAKNIDAEVLLNTPVLEIRSYENHAEVQLEGSTLTVDHIYSTLPARAMAQIIPREHLSLKNELSSIPEQSMTCVSFTYDKPVLSKKGFGYLVPSDEQADILGVFFDSAVFPEQNSHQGQTRLSVMLGEQAPFCQADCLSIAENALKKDLKISSPANAHYWHRVPSAIPQYNVGHQKKADRIESLITAELSNVTLLGTSLYGVAVNDCIARAKKVINS